MPFFLQLCRSRRVWLVVLLAVFSLVIGLWALPTDPAITAAVKSGYWVLLALVALFARAAWRVGCDAWRARRPGRVELAALALVLAGGGVLLAHETYGFKVLEDEVLLLGTSMGMHLDRAAAYADRASDVQGPFQLVHLVLDKRPFLFPFVVALVHDLTGYRPDNPFYVNTVLGFVLLALLWLLGRGIGGSPWAGAVMVLLFSGLPLLGQQMAGGGFDLLNLVMLTAVVLLAREFAERRDAVSQEALVLGAVLLAYSRYESVLFLVPVAALVPWAWWRDGRITLTWPVILSPLALLPWLWQHRVFTINAGAWELASHPGADAPFAWHYLPGNLGHGLMFFLDADRDHFLTGYQPSSPLFSVLGLLALPFFGLWISRVLRAPGRAAPADLALAVLGVGLLAETALLLCYFLPFDTPMVHRLSLPVHLLLAVAVVLAGARLWLSARGWKVLAGAVVGALVVQGLPAMATQAYTRDYSPGLEMAWRREFLQRYPEHDYLFIDQDSPFWIDNKVCATPPEQARRRQDNLVWLLRNHAFTEMYVFQQFKVDDQTGALHLDPADDLGPDFELEPVWDRRIEILVIDRISRVTAIHTAVGETVRQTHLAAPAPGPDRTSKELEQAKDEYLQHWLDELP